MERLMEGLAVFIGQFINPVIIVFFITTFAGFFSVVYNSGKLQNEMEEKRNRKVKKDYTAGGIKKIVDPETWEEILEYLEKFNKIQLTYSIFEQFVPVFPLLGILGTVSGLISQLENIDEMRNAMALSMSTTFLGLIAAIILRLADVFVSKRINKMSLYFETYEMNYQMVKDKHTAENE